MLAAGHFHHCRQMPHLVESSSRRRFNRRPDVGEETRLPLVKCPTCKTASVIERQSRKENENNGRVYFKCSRNFSWLANRCPYYNWQSEYFEELVSMRLIQVKEENDFEIEEEVISIDQQICRPTDGSDLERKMKKLIKAVMFMFVLFVGFVSIVVGYALKK
ncbi:unnamed protein product [Urochloa humidicola]